jgi:26S proteasome regulatory subunit N11
MNLHKEVWTEGLELPGNFEGERKRNEEGLKQLVHLAEGYEKRVREEGELTKDQLKTRYVGKVDPKKRKFYSSRAACLSLASLTDLLQT